ncbi:MAG TPA: TetR/AcrR family transcriptional regulator [Polyangiaceae bacterium]
MRATARILVKRGYQATTTNHIAEAAGVSVGSLYQYFPNKEAIVAALLDEHLEESQAFVRAGTANAIEQSLEEAARGLIQGLLDAHRVDPKLHRVFVEELPRIATFERIHQLEQDTLALVRAYIEVRLPEIAKKRKVDVVAFVIVHAVEAVTHGAVLFRPDLLEDPAFVDEVVRLVVRYAE